MISVKTFLPAVLLAVASTACYANITVKDYTHAFDQGFYRLKDKTPSAYKRYILNYELYKQPQVSRLFFDGHPIPRDPRIEKVLNQYAHHLPNLVKAYEQKVPEVKSIAAEVEERTQKLFGMKINANVVLSTSVSETDAVTTGRDDGSQATVALNLREMVKYSKDDLRIVLAHELFHVLQHQIERDHSGTEMIPGNLYSEGWATYASSLVYPGYSDWKYISYFHQNDKQFLKFEADRKDIIQHLLRDWGSNNNRKFDKYFSGNGDASAPFEPRSGYYIGYMVAKYMAREQSPVKVALISYQDFKKQIKPMLKKLSEVG